MTGIYHPHSVSQVCHTSWALLCLISARYPEREPIQRAIDLIMGRQLEDGSWAQEDIEGIFVSLSTGCTSPISKPGADGYYAISSHDTEQELRCEYFDK